MKPWGDALEGEQLENGRLLLEQLSSSSASCEKSLEADLSLHFKTPIDKMAVSGFFQFSAPGSYKFVVTTPFGQPLIAIAGNQKTYQHIDTSQQKYTYGNLDSFCLRNQLSTAMLHGNWWDWLTGATTYKGDEVSAIAQDRSSSGLWFTLTTVGHMEHLLVNGEKLLVEKRIIEELKGKRLAQITYSDYQQIGRCQLPGSILIDGLDYGSTINFSFSEVTSQETPQSYTLPIPRNYQRQYLP